MLALVVIGVIAVTACSRFNPGRRREAADRLRRVDALLDRLSTAYAAGKHGEARQLAADISALFDETVAERVLKQVDSTLGREVDEVLTQQLPEKVRERAPRAAVQALVVRAHDLVRRSLEKLR